MQQQTKVATPEYGCNVLAAISLKVPTPLDQPELKVAPIISGFSEENLPVISDRYSAFTKY